MFVRVGKSASNCNNVACPKALRAASVGANNVNGPAADKVPSKPQVSIANSKRL